MMVKQKMGKPLHASMLDPTDNILSLENKKAYKILKGMA
jgi:hypothetical protein